MFIVRKKGVKVLNFLQALSDWNKSKREQFRTDMESLGKCPDCRGRGYTTIISSVYIPTYESILDCHSCNGTGAYSES